MKRPCGVLLIGIAVSQLLGTYALADIGLVNGDFSSGLAGWTSQVVTVDSGVATMGEDLIDFAFLEQEFTIPELGLSLSFDYRPHFETDGQESFSASLLDPVSYAPLIPTDADPFDPSETYYFMHDWDDGFVDEVLTDPLYVTQTDLGGDWTRVTLDLTSLGGLETEALLAFDFVPGFFDFSLDGEIDIAMVDLDVVPVPPAVVLGLLGLGVAGVKIARKREA